MLGCVRVIEIYVMGMMVRATNRRNFTAIRSPHLSDLRSPPIIPLHASHGLAVDVFNRTLNHTIRTNLPKPKVGGGGRKGWW